MIKDITIGKKKIKIKVVQKIPGEPKSVLGVFDAGDRIIYLRKQDQNELVYTLLHELMHAVIWNKSLHNLVKPNVEEVICDVMAETFVDFVNNKELYSVIRKVRDGKN